MSESAVVGGDDFDVEAQQSLLVETTINEPGLERSNQLSLGLGAATTTTNSSPRETLMRMIWVLRSTVIFMSTANVHASLSFASSSSYYNIMEPDDDDVDDDDNDGDDDYDEDLGNPGSADLSPRIPEDSSDLESPSQDASTSTKVLRIQKLKISEIVKEKNLVELRNFGGVKEIAKVLNTDLENGISTDFPAAGTRPKRSKLTEVLTFFHFFPKAFKNVTVFLLSFAGVLSLSFGIQEEGLRNGWFDSAILFTAVFWHVVFTAARDYVEDKRKIEKQWFSKVSNEKAQVIRKGSRLSMPAHELIVGDLVHLERGFQVPGDGIFVDGQALLVDGGCKAIINKKHPFLFYGTRVINGNARMIVTSVGRDTVWGGMMSGGQQLRDKKCKFESCLHGMNTCIHIAGLLISILILIVLFIRYVAGKIDDDNGFRPDPKAEPTRVKFLVDAIKRIVTGSKGIGRVLTTLLSVSLVGIMEGIPFVITLAITLWSEKVFKQKALETETLASLTLASITRVCTDKLGGLSEHKNIVDKLFVDNKFVNESSTVARNILEALCDGIGASVLLNPSGDDLEDLPIVSWAEDKLGMRRETLNPQCRIINDQEGDTFRECCGAMVVRNGDNGQECYLHYKGPPGSILSMCTSYYNLEGKVQAIDDQKRATLEKSYLHMSSKQQVIAYACKQTDECDNMSHERSDLIFLGMISLKGTMQENTRNVVPKLKHWGIKTTLVSGDDVEVLKTIGHACELLPSDSLVLKGEEFAAWSDEERMEKVDKICIMGNCRPSDKFLLVNCLKQKGEVVAFLGQRTSDAPALNLADIGITLGTWSSEIARESSEIIIHDEDLSFIIDVIESVENFLNNIRKFIQLNLITTISSTLINFIATVSLGDAPMTAIQLFWLNLFVSVLGGLALLTGPQMKRLAQMNKSSRQLITKAMFRNIAIQVSYQTTVFVVIQHKGHSIPGFGSGLIKSTLYYGFYMCQSFNIFIARELEDNNIFKGLLLQKNIWFWAAYLFFLLSLLVVAAAESLLAGRPALNLKLSAICFLMGLISLPLDLAGKCASNLITRWTTA